MSDSATLDAPQTETAPATEAEASPVESREAAQEAAMNEWFEKNAEADSAPAKPVESSKPQTTPQPDNEPAATQATQPIGLTDSEKTLIKRYGLDESDLSDVLPTLKPESRQKFLANLERRAKHHDELTAKLNQPAPAAPATPPPAAQVTQATEQQTAQATADAWAKLEDTYGADYVAEHRPAFQQVVDQQVQQAIAAIEQRYAPLNAYVQAQMRSQFEADRDAGFAEMQLPSNIEATPEIRERVFALAKTLVQQGGGYNPTVEAQSLKHAIPVAAASLFHKELLADRGRATVQRQRSVLRSQPTPASQIRRTPPANKSRDELIAEWFERNPE